MVSSEQRLAKLEKSVAAITERNRRVELDKAWETSRFRATVITAITFVITYGVFGSTGADYPLLNAAVATIAFIASIQSLPFIKRWWLKRRT